MKKNIEIKNIGEMDRDAATKNLKENEYSQPCVDFEYEGDDGIFNDYSDGVYGTRFEVKIKGKKAFWGNLFDRKDWKSDFTEEEKDFLNAFKRKFGISIPTEEDIKKYN